MTIDTATRVHMKLGTQTRVGPTPKRRAHALVALFPLLAASGGCSEEATEETAQSTQAVAFIDTCKDACDEVVDLVLDARSCDEATRRLAQRECYEFCDGANQVVATAEEARAAIEEAVREMKEKVNLPFTATVTAALDACHTTVQYVSPPTISATTGAAIVTIGLVVGGIAVVAACTTGTVATGGILGLVCAPLTLQVGTAVAAVALTVNMGGTANACSPVEVQGHTSCEPSPEPQCGHTTDQESCVQCVTQFEADRCLPTVDGSLWGAPFWDSGYCNTGWAGCDQL